MLAAKSDVNEWKYPCLVSPKLDGIRALVSTSGPQSRSGKPFANTNIRDWLADLPAGLDGELVTGDPTAPDSFARTCSVVNSHDAPIYDTAFYVYDYFLHGGSTVAIDRMDMLKKVALPHHRKGVELVGQALVQNAEQAESVAAHFEKRGYEGACARYNFAYYKFGRCARAEHGLVARKTMLDMEVIILYGEEKLLNHNEQTQGPLGYAARATESAGKVTADTLGGFRVKGLNGPFKGVEFSLGTGTLKAWEARNLWRESSTLAGRIATIKFQPHGSKDKPRSPQFYRWRLDADLSA